MKQKHLKAIRVVISVLFLLLISLLFVDFREMIPTAWADRILFLQFIPSLIRFVTITTVAATGFMVVLVLTALFGRVYCSALCPLGTFQDVFSWIAKHVGLVKRYRYKKALDYLRYPFLALTIIFLVAGSLFVVNLLDPYSSYGRIFSDILRPGIIVANNALAGLLERFGVYALYLFNLELITWRTVLIPFVTLILVVGLSLLFGRLYCNTVCPVGTVLGLLSRFSLFRIKMDALTCTKCGKCAFACKSNCIQVKTLTVDHSRCVACYNCISVCPENSIRYTLSDVKRGRTAVADTDTAKRDFIGKTLLYGAALAGISNKSLGQVESERPAGKIPNPKNHPVSPPGSVSIKHFTDRCTACHLCVTVCPTSVLQPSFLEYGFLGMSQPHMDYSVEYCNFECTKCGEVCPTGAILPLTVEDKKLEQTGQVQFIIEKCIVYTDNTACGSCSEHCPTQAVKMVPYKEGLTIPETDTEICIGCGACEFACPVKPHEAIYVDGNAVHQVAKAPHIEELELQEQEEFPF
jgi:ferredoxin-type protein NapF